MAAAFSKEAGLTSERFSLIAETHNAADDGPLPRLRRGPRPITGLLR